MAVPSECHSWFRRECPFRLLTVSLCAQASQTAEDAMQMEQMTKEKTETLASLEDTKQTNAKLQNEVSLLTSWNVWSLKSVSF